MTRNGRCVKEPGLLKADWGRPKLWWEWLEGPLLDSLVPPIMIRLEILESVSGTTLWPFRPDPLDWKSGLKSAVKSMAGDFLSNFFDNDKHLRCNTCFEGVRTVCGSSVTAQQDTRCSKNATIPHMVCVQKAYLANTSPPTCHSNVP